MNYYGLYTLYYKEVRRFIKVYNQTIIAPLINALLLLAIFTLAFSGRVQPVEGLSVQHFILPGLIMMTIIQNAFANTSSTLTFGKVLGSIVDILIPPLSAKELTIAISLGGATRGIIGGLVVILAVYAVGYIFDSSLIIDIHSFGLVVFYIIASALALSLIGMIAGIFSDSFDQMSAITSFVITPLSFLSGTFYSVKKLPEFWQSVNNFNPFFYMIDGFRYAMTGYSDASIETGISFIVILNIVLYAIVYLMLNKGYRIRS